MITLTLPTTMFGQPTGIVVVMCLLGVMFLVSMIVTAIERHTLSGHDRRDQFCDHWTPNVKPSPSITCPHPHCQARRLAWQTGRPFTS